MIRGGGRWGGEGEGGGAGCCLLGHCKHLYFSPPGCVVGVMASAIKPNCHYKTRQLVKNNNKGSQKN